MMYTVGGYLCHHGILGMKWGVRRYQNSDGTLTDAGKKKYRKEYNTLRNMHGDHYISKTGIKKVDEYNKKKLEQNRDNRTQKLLKKIGEKV